LARCCYWWGWQNNGCCGCADPIKEEMMSSFYPWDLVGMKQRRETTTNAGNSNQVE